VRYAAEAMCNKIRGELVVRPRHGPQRISEVSSEPAQGVVMARFQSAGSILGEPDRASHGTADDCPALSCRVRSASGCALEPEGYRSWLGGCDRLSKESGIPLLRAV